MKILYLTSDNNNTSGAFLSAVALNRQLNANFGVETLMVLPCNGNGETLLKEKNIPYVRVQSYNWVMPIKQKKTLSFAIQYAYQCLRNHFAAIRIARVARKGKYDLIHINTLYSYVGAKAALMAKIPFVWHVREILEEQQNRKFINPKKAYSLLGKANRVIAISRTVYQKYCYLTDCKKLCVVYNGVEESLFYRPDKTIFNNEKAIILFVGGFNKHKGAYYICDTLAKLLPDSSKDIEVWFVGNPPEAFVKYVERLGIQDKIIFWGYQKNVEEFYEKCDIALSCAQLEAFGRTTAEALLSGALVITTDTGGSKEMVIDKVTGLLHQFGRPKQLADKIRYALSHKEEMRTVAKAGQAFAHENLTAHHNAGGVYKQYEKALRKLSAKQNER